MVAERQETRIYVACLASYNSGMLHGEWIDIDETTTEDDIQDAINAILRSSPCPNVEVEHPDGSGKVPSAEEWAVHDYEGPKGWAQGECPDIEALLESARLYHQHGLAWFAYVDLVGKDFADESDFEESYQGEYDSEEDYAENFLEETGGLKDMPESLRSYFDYKKYARDLKLGGDMAPWEYFEQKEWGGTGTYGCVRDAQGRVIVNGCAPGGTQEQKDNARLMAAAPEMLTVLIQAVESSCWSLSGPTDVRAAEQGEPAWVCNARATIAKAKGLT